MSIYNCHKQSPQPWMSYIASNMITYNGDCCPQLITDVYSLLPFQIISNGDFQYAEISPYGENDWSVIDVPITTVITDGFYIHSYDGTALSEELDCGAYDFRVVAGEMWWFEPFMVEDFENETNAFTMRDDLMLPFKFSEHQFEEIPIIAPCDSFLPFMYATENATTGTPKVYLIDSDCYATEQTQITLHTETISGKTYYWYEGECFYPFLECGIYRLAIVDGTNQYYSVQFSVECGISDIPDGYRPMLDFNRCVMRDENGDILYDQCYE